MDLAKTIVDIVKTSVRLPIVSALRKDLAKGREFIFDAGEVVFQPVGIDVRSRKCLLGDSASTRAGELVNGPHRIAHRDGSKNDQYQRGIDQR